MHPKRNTEYCTVPNGPNGHRSRGTPVIQNSLTFCQSKALSVPESATPPFELSGLQCKIDGN
jgi:hypothetical protein